MKYMLGFRNKKKSPAFQLRHHFCSVSFDECKWNQSGSSNKTFTHTHIKCLYARTHLTQSNEQYKTSAQQFTLSVTTNRKITVIRFLHPNEQQVKRRFSAILFFLRLCFSLRVLSYLQTANIFEYIILKLLYCVNALKIHRTIIHIHAA